MQDEQVLVCECKTLEELGPFQGLSTDVDRYVNVLFEPGVARFMSRSRAETDPTYKQLIPYVIMTCEGQYLTYIRGKGAGETRLIGNRSIGVGGHINSTDDLPLFDVDFRDAYLAAVEREVGEEVAVDDDHVDQVIALLNDDSTPVGQVHFGIVHLWTLASPKVAKREHAITQIGFAGLDELYGARGELETWSRLCVDYLHQAARVGKPP